jgi:diacylglycerol kinase (ATP)
MLRGCGVKTCVIMNPHSGTADAVVLRQAIEQLRLGDIVLRTTRQAGDATQFARAALADGCGLVVAAGGDGTINEVINGLAVDFSRARLGVIPLGTGNDFARAIHVPTDVNAAVDVLAGGVVRAVDLIRMTSDQVRYFINMSAGGFSGVVDEQLTEELKRTWGPLALLGKAAAALPNLAAYRTSVVFDDDTSLAIQAFNVIVANAPFAAGGIPIAPAAVIDDGLADVLIVHAASLAQLARLVPRILLGKHLDSSLVTFRRARKLYVESHPGMWFSLDGELVGNESARFEVLPRALKVIVGPTSTDRQIVPAV